MSYKAALQKKIVIIQISPVLSLIGLSLFDHPELYIHMIAHTLDW